ncbi:hypothetical protein H4W33_005875 [Kibdelosporangium phytohabitans]|uniref:Uncharacterized protein n=1 Tax=Kibdelosporangium phytohabitans TaxID=860235 RepID=A0A0N9IGT8_9PSEU|nr:hypothetical protein AOZ06_51295 [Kibdelosporangium phytohabitans]MBE1466863.1 hypothetical protein [Kibdelosporangium phytohabitans]
MSTLVHVLLSAPLPLATVALLLRYGPSALVFLVAGVMAVIAPGPQGDRALAVLRLLRTSAPPRALRGRRRIGRD